MDCKERFLKYVSFPTTSDDKSEQTPSTKSQFALAEYVADELKKAGVDEVIVDDKCYVYGFLPKNIARSCPTIGLVAHLDTSEECSGENIRPKTVSYDGGDIVLNSEKNIIMRVCDYPSLERYTGEDIIVTDGLTLLGADDKAGVSAIVTAIERIVSEKLPHGDIRVAFTPDEEIGRGTDFFDIAGFKVDYAYTVDGGALGEIEYENFNAASAVLTVNGVSIHPGSAKDKMKNAVLIAMEFNSLLPENEIPSKTEGYEGFQHIAEFEGRTEKAVASYIIRDHDKQKFEAKKALFRDAANKINEIYGDQTAELVIKDSYFNMKEIIEKRMYIIERAEAAMKKIGIVPNIIPIRGGTDGARLSFEGIPCPNLCTGGENFHSRFEYLPVHSLEKVTELVVTIITDLAENIK